MKKTFLRSAAIAMAVTGASAAHAVHVNHDGLGQVLLYPYYTVQNNFVTAIHVVNTTDHAKAVKVRFLEGKNSQEVLDFNLYLSPYDVWTGSVVRDATNGAKLVTADTSCTVPAIPAAGVPFKNTAYMGDPLANDPNRRAEGYVEIIEMAELTDSTQIAAVTHVNGVPKSCATIVAADFAGSVGVSAPGGGLFGSGHLVSVDGGVRTSFDPVALENFSETPLWYKSGGILPTLGQVNPARGEILDGAEIVRFFPLIGRPAVDAVSAVLTHSSLSNEYAVDAGRLSQTDWIVTFPTKRFYVNKTNWGPLGLIPTSLLPSPFQSWWTAEAPNHSPVLQSCHKVHFQVLDREEFDPESLGSFSPPPPVALCNEVNTITLHQSAVDSEDAKLFGAQSTAATLAVNDLEAGWMRMTFGVDPDFPLFPPVYGALYYYDTFYDTFDPDGFPIPNGRVNSVNGLPAIGFSASRNVNTVDVQIGGLNVYSAVMGSNAHKGEKAFEYAHTFDSIEALGDAAKELLGPLLSLDLASPGMPIINQ